MNDKSELTQKLLLSELGLMSSQEEIERLNELMERHPSAVYQHLLDTNQHNLAEKWKARFL